jgi:hypothetical protein
MFSSVSSLFSNNKVNPVIPEKMISIPDRNTDRKAASFNPKEYGLTRTRGSIKKVPSSLLQNYDKKKVIWDTDIILNQTGDDTEKKTHKFTMIPLDSNDNQNNAKKEITYLRRKSKPTTVRKPDTTKNGGGKRKRKTRHTKRKSIMPRKH